MVTKDEYIVSTIKCVFLYEKWRNYVPDILLKWSESSQNYFRNSYLCLDDMC